jgi:hypothetical protein
MENIPKAMVSTRLSVLQNHLFQAPKRSSFIFLIRRTYFKIKSTGEI